MTTAHKIIRQIMKKQLPQIATIDLIQLIALWAEQMRSPTWETPTKLDPDIIEDIQDATAELLTRTKQKQNQKEQPMTTRTPCQWENRRAHFTGTPYAECQTCYATCHYYENAEELTANCQHIEHNKTNQ